MRCFSATKIQESWLQCEAFCRLNMDNLPAFQKLKQLHEHLHSSKGFTAIRRTCVKSYPSDEKCVYISPQNEELVASSINLEKSSRTGPETGGDTGVVEEPANLIKAVKNIYDGTNVKLIPHKIFVGNISYKLSTSQLRSFFTAFGKAVHAQIIKERGSRRSKGYGFVTFSKESEVENVLQASDEELLLDGRVLRVNRAEKKRRGRPIHELGSETDPKASLQDFVKKYNEATEDYKQSQDKIQSVKNGQDINGAEINEKIYEISALNDDTLLHIFSFLNVKDRVRIEQVCHRWLQLARQSWLFINHLDFKGVFGFLRGAAGLSDAILLSLFRRGCQNLKSLDLSHSPTLLTDFSLYLIRQNCVHLEELNLSGVNVTMKSLKDLSVKCCKLKKIGLQRCHGVGEKGLWWLFKQCKELEYIDVGRNARLTGQCFFMLTDNCTTVIVNECIKLTDDGLQRMTQRCLNLRELNISNCLHLTDIGVSELFKACRNLKKLEFCKSPKNVSSQSLMELKNLNLLEELQLAEQVAVDDDVLLVIGRNCPNLRFMNLAACHKVTDQGIQCLASCFSLDKLNMSYLDKVTDAAVIAIALLGSLKTLRARSCFNLTDKAIEQLVVHCADLQELDLSGTERIRKRSLDLLQHYLGEKEKITLAIGGTGITIEQAMVMQKRHPSWNITTLDMSDYHLRVDFDPLMDMGHILYQDDEEEAEEEEEEVHDAEYYLSSLDDDPSMWEYDGEWRMS